MKAKPNRKAEFIRGLAEFLVSGQATKSIELEMGEPSALAWSKLRSLTPIFGYSTVEEAIETLTEFLQ